MITITRGLSAVLLLTATAAGWAADPDEAWVKAEVRRLRDSDPNAWKRIQTLLEAEKIAAAARAAKDQDKVAYGRRIARRQKHFSGTQSGPSPGAQSGPETAKFPGTQSGPTGPGTHSGPTIDISGGDGAAGGTPALTELPLH